MADGDRTSHGLISHEGACPNPIEIVWWPIPLRRKREIIAVNEGPSASRAIRTEARSRLLGGLAHARRLLGEITSGAVADQADVARALGRHQPFVANIEQAQRRVGIVEFLKLARIFKFDPAAAHAALDAGPEED